MIKEAFWTHRDTMTVLVDRLNAFAREVVADVNALVTTSRIADGAVTLDKIAAVPAASVSRTVAQSIPNATDTQVTFDTLDYAIGGSDAPLVANASPTSIIVQRAGLYRVTAITGISATVDAAGNQVNTTVFTNGFLTGTRIIDARIRSLAGWTYYTSSRDVVLAVGDVVTMGFYQVNGGALNTATVDVAARPRLQIAYLGGT